jgi:ribosomal protein S18 acetylase RimI-like enzyme
MSAIEQPSASKLRVRPAKATDMPFVHDSWRRSFEGAPAVRLADREHLRVEMRRVINRLCDHATVLVACDTTDEDTLVGFAAFTERDGRSELHYVYVKKDFRGMGIARSLLANARVATFTFLTPSARPRKGWVFTPRFTI